MNASLRVVITGASSGLGREMAVQLGRRGARVAVTGRRQAKLEETARLVREAGGEPLMLLGDVADLAEVKRHYALIKEAWGGLDWAILNAAVGDSSNARSFSAENYRWTFATNIGGVVNWMEAVLPDMIAAASGTIAGISSLAGFRGLPASGSYSSSKAALTTLLESARVDLRGTGVRVVTICPGFIKSEMTARNDPKELWFMLETEDGAARILRGVERGCSLVHFPWQLSWPMKYVIARLPNFIYDPIFSKFVKRNKKPYIDESKLQ